MKTARTIDMKTARTIDMKTANIIDINPVEISCHAPEAKVVFVAGTFNDWKPDNAPLRSGANGDWAITLPLPRGRHEYKFVVDGRWCCEPDCEEESRGGPDRVPNAFGTMNRVLEVT